MIIQCVNSPCKQTQRKEMKLKKSNNKLKGTWKEVGVHCKNIHLERCMTELII